MFNTLIIIKVLIVALVFAVIGFSIYVHKSYKDMNDELKDLEDV